jgi:deleted in liver cancer protein
VLIENDFLYSVPSKINRFEIKVPHVKSVAVNYLSVPPAGAQDNSQNNLKRSGSERLRDGAKSILRRVESIKSRRKKKKNREGVVISGPMQLDIMQLHQKFNNLSTKDIKASKSTTTSPLPMSPVGNPSSPLFLFADPKIYLAPETHAAMFGQHCFDNKRLTPYAKGHPASRTSPLHFFSQKKSADDSSSYCSEVSQDSSNGSAEKKLSPVGRYFQKTKKTEDTGTLSDSEAFNARLKKKSHKTQKSNTLVRGGGGSLNLGRDSSRHRENLKAKRIFRSRSAVRHTPDNDSSQDVTLRPKSGALVQRWHSFRAQTNTKRDFADGEGVSLCKLSCGQIEKLRSLALVTLTGYMER